MLSLKLLVIKDRRRQEGLRGRNQLSPEVWSPHVEGRREVPGDGTLAGPHPLLTLLRCLLREAGDRTVEDIHWQLSYRDYTGTGRDAWRTGSVSPHGGGRRREGRGRAGGYALPVLAANQSASGAGSRARLPRRPDGLERIPCLAGLLWGRRLCGCASGPSGGLIKAASPRLLPWARCKHGRLRTTEWAGAPDLAGTVRARAAGAPSARRRRLQALWERRCTWGSERLVSV